MKKSINEKDIFFNNVKQTCLDAEIIELPGRGAQLNIEGKTFDRPLLILCSAPAYIHASKATLKGGIMVVGYKGGIYQPAFVTVQDGYFDNARKLCVGKVNLDIVGVSLDVREANISTERS